jgi:hypothetical protein
MMKRHRWEKGRKDLQNKFTEQEQCVKCGIYRIKAFGVWMYSKDKTTDKNPFAKEIRNPGCV